MITAVIVLSIWISFAGWLQGYMISRAIDRLTEEAKYLSDSTYTIAENTKEKP